MFQFSEDQLALAERPVWPKGEIITLVCLDFQENAETKDVTLRCKVLSDRHHGRMLPIYVQNRDHEVAQKIRVQFALAFWTREELMAGEAKPTKLINRKFTVVAGAVREYQGKTYQNYAAFKDAGEFVGDAVTSADLQDSEGNPNF